MSLMAALAAGCSSDDIVDDGGKKPGITEGKSYVSMNITLPTTNGTRSQNDQFNNGDPNEYKVNEVKISFYTFADGTYTHIEKADLTYSNTELAWTSSTESGVTTKALLPVKQVKFDEKTTAYALVEVNPITKEGWAVNTDNNAVKEMTAEDLTGKNEDAFFMTNTVWDDGSYLVEIHSYKTELEARNHANDYNIYVERAVAKATLNVGTENNWGTEEDTKTTYTIPTAEEGKTNVYAGATVKIDGWKLDVTNKKMYPIRKFAGTGGTYSTENYSRFYSQVTYGTNSHRTYWAEDPNYSDYAPNAENNGQGENFNVISETEVTNPVGSNEYCLENTFNTTHQRQNETTRMVVKAIYTPAGMTFGENEAHTWYTIGSSTTAYKLDNVKTLIANAYNETVTNENKVNGENVELVNVNAGVTKLAKTNIKINNTEVTDSQLAAITNRLGSTITTYENGVCYYAIRIRHLDYYCPWGDENTDKGYMKNAPSINGTTYVTYDIESNGKPVEQMEQNYLGRYGVVRNNWYQVTINKVTQPGSPTIPALTNIQDDEQYYYLQANINILDWAVRTQGVEL